VIKLKKVIVVVFLVLMMVVMMFGDPDKSGDSHEVKRPDSVLHSYETVWKDSVVVIGLDTTMCDVLEKEQLTKSD